MGIQESPDGYAGADEGALRRALAVAGVALIEAGVALIEKETRIKELERALAIRDGAEVCESCGKLIQTDDPRHNWHDGVTTCVKCGGPEGEQA